MEPIYFPVDSKTKSLIYTVNINGFYFGSDFSLSLALYFYFSFSLSFLPLWLSHLLSQSLRHTHYHPSNCHQPAVQ